MVCANLQNKKFLKQTVQTFHTCKSGKANVTINAALAICIAMWIFFLIKITSDNDNQLIFFLSMQLTSEILE